MATRSRRHAATHNPVAENKIIHPKTPDRNAPRKTRAMIKAEAAEKKRKLKEAADKARLRHKGRLAGIAALTDAVRQQQLDKKASAARPDLDPKLLASHKASVDKRVSLHKLGRIRSLTSRSLTDCSARANPWCQRLRCFVRCTLYHQQKVQRLATPVRADQTTPG